MITKTSTRPVPNQRILIGPNMFAWVTLPTRATAAASSYYASAGKLKMTPTGCNQLGARTSTCNG